MENLIIPVGFKQLESRLRQAAVQARVSMNNKVAAAITFSALVLVKIGNEELEKLLNIPATLKENGFLTKIYPIGEIPALSLLSCIILAGIEKSQRQDQSGHSAEEIHISGSDFLAAYKFGQRLDNEFAEIEKLTNGFIKIHRFLYRNPSTGNYLISAVCDYTKDFSENFVTA